MKMSIRLLSLLLAMILCVGVCVPATVYATDHTAVEEPAEEAEAPAEEAEESTEETEEPAEEAEESTEEAEEPAEETEESTEETEESAEETEESTEETEESAEAETPAEEAAEPEQPLEGAAEAQVVVGIDENPARTVDGAAFGELCSGGAAAQIKAAWTNDAISAAAAKELLNGQTLYPQRTGWAELDQVIGDILAGAGENADTYTKLRYAYDWLVKRVSYSWDGYSYYTASVKCYNSFTEYNYLKNLTYEEGLEKSIPDDMANRTYHILTKKRGVCYDYSIAFAVIARYVGIDAYVHTGLFTFENTSLGQGHHGWAVLMLNGEKYVFDPQRDARNYEYYDNNGYYFGIAAENANRYDPNDTTKGNNKTANAERDAQMLSVKAERDYKVDVQTVTKGGGTIQLDGTCMVGTEVTLTAIPEDGYGFIGWYDEEDELLGTQNEYTFTAQEDVTVRAKFGLLITVPVVASRSGTVTGNVAVKNAAATLKAVPDEGEKFEGWYDLKGNLLSSKAEYTVKATEDKTYVAMFKGDVFYDVSESDWYVDEVMDAVELGLLTGVTPIEFDDDGIYTRAMVVVMLARLDGADVSAAPQSGFRDVPAGQWYTDAVNWAYAEGIVKGKSATKFAPADGVTREEFITMMVRYAEAKVGTLTEKEINYTDAEDISAYALPMVKKASAMGLVEGYTDGSLKPAGTLVRREGVTVMVRLAKYLN